MICLNWRRSLRPDPVRRTFCVNRRTMENKDWEVRLGQSDQNHQLRAGKFRPTTHEDEFTSRPSSYSCGTNSPSSNQRLLPFGLPPPIFVRNQTSPGTHVKTLLQLSWTFRSTSRHDERLLSLTSVSHFLISLAFGCSITSTFQPHRQDYTAKVNFLWVEEKTVWHLPPAD